MSDIIEKEVIKIQRNQIILISALLIAFLGVVFYQTLYIKEYSFKFAEKEVVVKYRGDLSPQMTENIETAMENLKDTDHWRIDKFEFFQKNRAKEISIFRSMLLEVCWIEGDFRNKSFPLLLPQKKEKEKQECSTSISTFEFKIEGKKAIIFYNAFTPKLIAGVKATMEEMRDKNTEYWYNNKKFFFFQFDAWSGPNASIHQGDALVELTGNFQDGLPDIPNNPKRRRDYKEK